MGQSFQKMMHLKLNNMHRVNVPVQICHSLFQYLSLILSKQSKKDAFFNPHKRAKLIRKACEAMARYCHEQDIVPSKELREDLAKTLVKLAPRSLSDPTTGKRGQPSAHVRISINNIIIYISRHGGQSHCIIIVVSSCTVCISFISGMNI